MLNWSEILMKAADKYGVASVCLIVMVSALAWHGNKQIESNVDERRKMQSTIEQERNEEKAYFRSEFKGLVDTTVKAIDRGSDAIDDSNEIIKDQTEQSQETKEVLQDLKTVIQSLQK